MLNVPLLLIGDATDGPTEEWVRVESLDQVIRLFGGYIYEQITLASGSTTYTLSGTPWGNDVTSMKVDTDGTLIEQRLYDFAVSGSVLTWSPPGDTITGPIIFRVLEVPSGTALVRGILNTVKAGADIYVVRVGGVHGTITTTGFAFSAIYAGSRYNGTTVQITSGGAVTVTPSPGTGRTITYNVRTDAELRKRLSDEVARGSGPILLDTAPSQSAFTLTPGTYTVTGGTNGQLTQALLEDFVNQNDLAGVDVLCPMGFNTNQVSGILQVLNGTDYPTLVVAQATITGDALSGTLNTNRYLCSVGFNTTFELGAPRQRIDPAAPLVAAMIATDNFSRTLAPLPEFPPSPIYGPTAITLIAASGHTVAYKSISKGWALWRVQTGDTGWPVSLIRTFQRVVRPIYQNLEPLLGESFVDLEVYNEAIEEALATVEGSKIISWNLALHGDTLYADVAFRPYGEVRVVQAQITLGSNATASP